MLVHTPDRSCGKVYGLVACVILPDTALENAGRVAEKLRHIAETVRPSWEPFVVTISAVAAECSSRASEDAEDRVTEWINRAESGIEEVRQNGGNRVMALATP